MTGKYWTVECSCGTDPDPEVFTDINAAYQFLDHELFHSCECVGCGIGYNAESFVTLAECGEIVVEHTE